MTWITAQASDLNEHVQVRVNGTRYLLTSAEALILAEELRGASGLYMACPTSLGTLRLAIDQRQHELIARGMLPHGDFLLNAMQQVYYTAKGEVGPNAKVFELSKEFRRMIADRSQEIKPPEAK